MLYVSDQFKKIMKNGSTTPHFQYKTRTTSQKTTIFKIRFNYAPIIVWKTFFFATIVFEQCEQFLWYHS